MFSQKYHTEGCGRFLGDSHTVASIRNNDGLKTSRYSIKAVLERRGVTASGRRVGGIMRERGTWARTRADDPNRTGCGLANRGIVGHSVGRARDAGLVLAAFCTLDFPLVGVQVFRTGRGGEFDDTRIDELLDVLDIKGSLPRKGNPYDNAVVESTDRLLKKELVYRNRYTTIGQPRRGPGGCVWWSDDQRLHPPSDTEVRRNSPNRDSSSKKLSNTPLPIQYPRPGSSRSTSSATCRSTRRDPGSCSRSQSTRTSGRA